MLLAVARSAALPVNRQVARPTTAEAVISAVVAVAVVSATARLVLSTPRLVQVAGVRPLCLSSRAKIAPFTVVIVTSPSHATSTPVLADRAGKCDVPGYCKPEWFV